MQFSRPTDPATSSSLRLVAASSCTFLALTMATQASSTSL
eukprot:CAMPEP_0173202036 /NCGR_PEP_ID=MMETSP1141-20130122/18711_1 /TAXON_ID=483371 /ORGANISM="non described non described, Strain CCMP2298" /LENGTH=39 /DNA_ID= /DNA_START= /DNA_END= /DNA_ORIENTATION=